MDDINRRMLEARRQQARTEPLPPERPAPEPAPVPPPTPPPVGETPSAELRMERRQGEWRYYLGEDRIRPGSEIEFYVDARIGWVRGTFQWGRRNVSVPTIRVALFDPAAADAPIGEMEVTLPDGARCRLP